MTKDQQVNVRLTPKLAVQLNHLAKLEDKPASAVVRDLIEDKYKSVDMGYTIGVVHTLADADPYHADTNGLTSTVLKINPREKTVSIVQEFDDNSTPSDEWHGLTLCESLPSGLDEYDARSILTDNSLVRRIIAGYKVEWDGSNMVGALDPNGQDAIANLVRRFDFCDLSDWSVWFVDDWITDAIDGITAKSSDAQVRRIARQIEDIARSEKVKLLGDVDQWVFNYRKQLREG